MLSTLDIDAVNSFLKTCKKEIVALRDIEQ